MTKNRTLLGCFLTAALAAPPALAQTPAPAPRPPTTPPATLPPTATAPASRPAAAPTSAPAVKPQTSTPIPAGAKTGANAPAQTVLDAFVKPEVSNLALSDSKAQSAARTRLEEGPLTGLPNQPPSVAFLQAYGATLNREVLALLRSPQGADWRTRLNAAIVVARVAERMEADKADSSVALAPAVIALVDDKLTPIVIWGVKAAKYVVPRQFDKSPPIPANQSVAAAVVRALTRFPTLDILAEDGYDALAGSMVRGAGGSKTRDIAALPYIQDLMRARIGVYAKADVNSPDILNTLPGAPQADDQFGLLLLSGTWPKAGKPQQQKSAQILIDLMKEANRISQAVAMPLKGAGESSSISKDDFVGILRQGGSVTVVVAGPDAKLKAAGNALSKVSMQTDSSAIDGMITELEAAYRAAGLLTAGGAAPVAETATPAAASAAAPSR